MTFHEITTPLVAGSRRNRRRLRRAAPAVGLRERLRALWIRAWAWRWTNRSGARRDPSPQALVRAVRAAWPRYWQRHMTRLLTGAARTPRLPPPPRPGENAARKSRIQ
jgi:hypothetical protein